MQPLLLWVLGGLFIGVLFVMFKKTKSKKPDTVPVKSLADAKITDARAGDTVSVLGSGDEFDDLDFTVDRRNRYESGDDNWHEVSGLYRGRRVFVEFYEDDVLEVSFTKTMKPLSLKDLGLEESDLIRMDDERTRANSFEHDGVTWSYKSSQEVVYFKNGTGEGEGFYSWEFESPDGRRLLFIEKWEDEPFEAGIAETVDPGDVRVFRT